MKRSKDGEKNQKERKKANQAIKRRLRETLGYHVNGVFPSRDLSEKLYLHAARIKPVYAWGHKLATEKKKNTEKEKKIER